MRTIVCLILLTLAAAEAADAQCRTRDCRDRARVHSSSAFRSGGPAQLGLRGGYDFTEDVGSVGAQVRLPVTSVFVVIPSGDVYFGTTPTEWQLNGDLAVRPPVLGGLYGGAGVAFLTRDFDGDGGVETEAGYNLLVGIDGGRVLRTRLTPFVEMRWTGVEDHHPFRLVAGVNVPVR